MTLFLSRHQLPRVLVIHFRLFFVLSRTSDSSYLQQSSEKISIFALGIGDHLLVVCTSSANCPPNGVFFSIQFLFSIKKSERTRRHILVTFQISLSGPACMTVAVGGARILHTLYNIKKQTNLHYSGHVHGNSCNGMIFQLPCYPGTSRKTELRLG